VANLDDEQKDIGSAYAELRRGLVSRLRRRFGDGPPDPEDAVQHAFERWMHGRSRGDVNDPEAFLYTAARNRILDERRRSDTRRKHIDSVLAGVAGEVMENVTPERVLHDRERLARLNAAISTLPEKQRVIVALGRLRGLTYAQIAQETGYSASDISRQMTAALIALKRAIEDEDR